MWKEKESSGTRKDGAVGSGAKRRWLETEWWELLRVSSQKAEDFYFLFFVVVSACGRLAEFRAMVTA